MKPKVWQIIGDKRPGGSNILVNQLISSRLGDRFSFSLLRLETAKQQLRHHRPDIILFHYPCAWQYLPDLLELKRFSPVYICDHHYCQGFEQNQVLTRWRFHLLLKLAYGIAVGVVAVSHGQRQWMIDRKLVPSTKITVITPASPVEKFLSIPQKTPSSPLILGAYGRFARQKGFEVLLKAIAPLPPDRFQLRLGGYGPDETLIQDLARSLPHVTLHGSIEDVPAFLAPCDAVVIPSRWEPWGLVALEAKAAGKPILASAVDGLSEQIGDGGLAIPADDVTALTRAIASLADSPLTDWGSRGRESVRHAWEDCLQHWEYFLERVTVYERQKTARNRP